MKLPIAPPQDKRFRYPGPESFRDDEADRRLFFGRDEDVAEVFNRVLSAKLLVLYAKSGLGKTSLLQAGLFPRLREEGLLPIRVRFNHREAHPQEEVRQAAAAACNIQGVALTPGKGETLWEYFNTSLFSRGDRFLSPILVMDQFEEVFTLQTHSFRLSLATELGHLMTGAAPPSVQKRLRAGDKLDYPVQPPNVRLLLSLREEYVGALQELAQGLPGILGNRYRLSPLDRAHALAAIENPARLPDPEGLFATRPFDFMPATDDVAGTVDEMLDFLESRHGEIEPFQLQVLCSHVERQVAVRQSSGEISPVVDLQGYLGGREGMEKVLQGFYWHALRSLPGWRVRRKARRLCEEGLLSPEGHRESLGRGQIKRTYGLSESQIAPLVEAKVLRREDRLDSFSYELSHDSLAKAVHASRQARRKTRKLAGFAVIVLVLGLAAWQGWLAQSAGQQAQANLAEYAAKVKELVDHGVIKQRDMVAIPAGSFLMGSNDGASDEKPVHQVTVKAFKMGRYEVSFEEYDEFAASTGRELPQDQGWGRGRQPVINVSFDDAVAYAQWLSEKTGKHFRLPSEAEWEYAARAGTRTAFYTGDCITTSQANYDGNYEYHNCGARNGVFVGRTAKVGSYPANPWGLYDMAGNVWEWTTDCYHETYQGAPADGSAWMDGAKCASGLRVFRGGSWFNGPGNLRSAYRGWFYPDDRHGALGFRLAQDL